MSTPENARLAAYQATRERLDARRTSGQVKCKPPNRRCGDRCIPPSWDCRLKGEGNDGHLKAVGKGSDPIAGFANLERGFTRLRKGALTLSFSELEGGRRAVARGAAKLSPGDLQQKKAVQDRVNQFAVVVGVPVALAVFAGLAHKGAKAFPAYARGPGAQIDEAASNVFRTVARNMPFTGAGTRAREAAGPTAANTAGRVFQTLQAYGPENLSRQAGSRSTLQRNVQQRIDLPNGGQPLIQSLNSVDRIPGTNKRSNKPYTEWDKESMVAFFSTKRTASMSSVDDLGEGSMFSVLATNDALSRSLNIPRHKYTNTTNQSQVIVSTTADFLRNSGDAIRTSMKEYGLNPKSREAVEAYIERIAPKFEGGDYAVDMRERLINATINGDYQRQAKGIYRETVQGFDDFYKRVVDDISNAPDISTSDRSPQAREALREAFANTYYRDAVVAHASYLHHNIDLPERVYGTNTATLSKRVYHAKKVVGRAKTNSDVAISLTSSEIFNAGREVAQAKNLPEPANVEAARQLLIQTYGSNDGNRKNGVGSIARVQAQGPRRRQTPQPTGQERSARRRVRGRTQIIRDLIKAGYSPESAATEADRIIAARRRADAYLLVRQDFTPTNKREGKPCGKSFIGKNEKCTKPGAKGYADPAQGQNPSTGLMQKVATGALVLGAAAAGGAAYKYRKPLGKGINTAKAVIKRERGVYKSILKTKQAQKNSYGGNKYNGRQARRAAREEYVQTKHNELRQSKFYTEKVNVAMAKGIRRLSEDDVRKALTKVPEMFRADAAKLVGKAKLGMTFVQLDASGYEMQKVNTKHNFTVWKDAKRDRYMSAGSTGDTLVTYISERNDTIDMQLENGRGMGVYDMQFMTDQKFDQKKGLSKEESSQIASIVKAMNKDIIETMPKNAMLKQVPYAKDGLGAKRKKIYERAGYRSLSSIRGNAMFATLSNGKVVPIEPKYEEFYADLLRGESYQSASEKFAARQRRDATDLTTRARAYLETKLRLDKKCGKTGIPDNAKCSKPVVQRVTEAALVTGVAAGAIGLIGLASRRKGTGPSPSTSPRTPSDTIPHPKHRSKADFHDLPNVPGVSESMRARRHKSNLEMNPIENSEVVRAVKSVAGHTPEGQLAAALIERHNLRVRPDTLEQALKTPGVSAQNKTAIKELTETMQTTPVMTGWYLDPNHPQTKGVKVNEVTVVHSKASKTEFKPTKEGVSASLDEYLMWRKKSPSMNELQLMGSQATKESISSFNKSFSTYHVADADNKDFIVMLHEMGHALDMGVSRGRRPPGSNAEDFRNQASRVISHYGLGDLESAQNEFFSESFVLYTLKPQALKKEAPLVYDWVDKYLKAMQENT